MLKINTKKRDEHCYIVIDCSRATREYEIGVYDEVMTLYFGEDYNNNKKYKYLKGRDTCGECHSGLGWYILKRILKKTRMQKIDVIKFVSQYTDIREVIKK